MIGITGATGKLGGRIARRLAAAEVPQRLIVRDASRAPNLPGATVAQGSYGEPGSALEGVDTLLMVSASESSDRLAQHRAFIDAAAAAGVGHLVYISFYGAAPDATFTLARDHFHTEECVKAAGLTHTFLRDCFYADFMPDLVGADGVIRGPAEDGRVAVVAQDDIADVAATVLARPAPHAGRTYSLTGPEALTLTEVAQILTETTGRLVRFENETLTQAYASRQSYGAPHWQLDAWVSTYTTIAAGEVAGVTGDVESITGHPATSLRDLLTR